MTGHVIWDWNGTLLDDFGLMVEASQVACRRVRPGAEVAAEVYRMHFTRPIRLFYERLLGGPVSDEEWALIGVAYVAHYEAHVDEVPLRPGALDVIGLLHTAGVSQSVLSLSESAHLARRLAFHGLDRYFLFAEGTPPGAPPESKAFLLTGHAERIRSTRPELTPADIVLVGDTTDDAVAAAAAGLRRVILQDGSFDAEQLRTLEALTAADLAGAVRAGLPHVRWGSF
jgi:phosphoglycolate phosphatase-like HAD superfamily hydrolase